MRAGFHMPVGMPLGQVALRKDTGLTLAGYTF